jgi:hypothetical protein
MYECSLVGRAIVHKISIPAKQIELKIVYIREKIIGNLKHILKLFFLLSHAGQGGRPTRRFFYLFI